MPRKLNGKENDLKIMSDNIDPKNVTREELLWLTAFSIDAVIQLLERKGILIQGEVGEEIRRLRGTADGQAKLIH